MSDCSFCGLTIEPGTGKLYVRKNGDIYKFCSSKCQNNYNLKRVNRYVGWTKAARTAKKN